MQAPGDPKEETAGGFANGGWTVPFFGEFPGVVAGYRRAGALETSSL